MSRVNRLLDKQRQRMAASQDVSGLVKEQLEEEARVTEDCIEYVERRLDRLRYVKDGEEHYIEAVTEDGHLMTYHDQHYQITRLNNGLPIEAKRMVDYKFDYQSAAQKEGDVSVTEAISETEPSPEYQSMKGAHEAQHPPEEE